MCSVTIDKDNSADGKLESTLFLFDLDDSGEPRETQVSLSDESNSAFNVVWM